MNSFLYCIHSITDKRQNVNSFFKKVINLSVCVIGARAYIVKAPDRRGLGGVFADVLLHPHHVVPAAELICAAREPADEAVTEVLMELLAVERQVFIRNRRVRDAGVDVRDVLQPPPQAARAVSPCRQILRPPR